MAKISMMPSSTPPSRAPGMEPMPPNTAAVKALMPGMEPVVGTKRGIGRAQQHAGDGRQAGADGEGQGDGGVDVDAHELGRALVLGAGPHGLAHLGLAGEPHQSAIMMMIQTHDGHQGHIGDASAARRTGRCCRLGMTDVKTLGLEDHRSAALAFCKK